MATPKPSKTAPVTPAEPTGSAEAQLTKFLNANKDEHFNYVEDANYAVSTGSLNLDAELGLLGPSLVRLVGPSASGKTSFAFGVTKEFLATVPGSRAVYIKAEGKLSADLKERTGLTFITDPKLWADGTVFVFESNVYEVVISLIRELITNNPQNHRYAFILDSMDGLILREDAAKTVDQNVRVAGAPKITKEFLQKVSVAMTKRGHLCFFLGQVSAEIKLDPYAKGPPRLVPGAGGSAVQHFASHVLEFQNWYEGDLILEKPEERLNRMTNKALGHICKVKINKTDREKRYVTVEIPIKHSQTGGGSIWREREIADALLMWQLVTKTNPNPPEPKKGKEEPAKDKKGGSWLYFAPSLVSDLEKAGMELSKDERGSVKIQGMNQLYDLLESRKDVSDYLFNRFRAMVGS
jgi:RecA/RadA recombinase